MPQGRRSCVNLAAEVIRHSIAFQCNPMLRFKFSRLVDPQIYVSVWLFMIFYDALWWFMPVSSGVNVSPIFFQASPRAKIPRGLEVLKDDHHFQQQQHVFSSFTPVNSDSFHSRAICCLKWVAQIQMFLEVEMGLFELRPKLFWRIFCIA